jgi:hypothetical protein
MGNMMLWKYSAKVWCVAPWLLLGRRAMANEQAERILEVCC